MQRLELATAIHILSTYSTACFSVKIVYNYGLEAVIKYFVRTVNICMVYVQGRGRYVNHVVIQANPVIMQVAIFTF
jgi:hypothetical protein